MTAEDVAAQRRAIPSRIDVTDDDRAIAWYGDGPLLVYESLAELLAAHTLVEDDLVPVPLSR